MTMYTYSIKDEDDIFGMPFTQANDELASVSVKSYLKRMPFMKIKLMRLGSFDTKTGVIVSDVQEIDYETVYADYKIKLAEMDNDGFEMKGEINE